MMYQTRPETLDVHCQRGLDVRTHPQVCAVASRRCNSATAVHPVSTSCPIMQSSHLHHPPAIPSPAARSSPAAVLPAAAAGCAAY